ncbi:MAG: ribosome-binding factor A [Alphaproteobacteria bacterium]|nr:ribosome-binding factor A [Alphaproteobacteria bacterium]
MKKLDIFIPKKVSSCGKRNNKIATQIKECFAVELLKRDFPPLPGHEAESKISTIVTITYVDVSPDLRNAIIYYMPLGGTMLEETAKFFELQTHYFKDLIAKKLKLRFIPNISFKLDESIDYAEKIDGLLGK